MKISIILPIYNTPKCILKSCFDSVKNQSVKDYELIVVDDGSDEICKKAIDEFAAENPFATVIHKENEGVSIARNVGMEYAKGEWFLFLDSDNTLPASTIENYLKYSDRYDIIIGQSICLSRSIKNDEDIVAPFDYTRKNKKSAFEVKDKDGWKRLIGHILVGREINFAFEIGYYADGPCGKLYRAAIAKQNPFPAHLKWNEDTVWLLEYLKRCKSALVIPDFIYDNISYQYSATKRFRENCVNEFEDVRYSESVLEQDFPDNAADFGYHSLQHCFLVIRTYFFHENNPAPLRKNYKEFSAWIKSSAVQKCVSKKTEMGRIPFSKRIVTYLMRNKLILPLYLVFYIYARN